ncbi:hypothetical protein ETR_09741 [Erwinia tracheiphila PSU-1]|nr:hypothetical protein ETR_09741 [Erwinia tracheiphila PSU-1]
MAGGKGQISDELRDKIAPLIPEHKTRHPPGTRRKRVDNRAAMNAIFFVPRTACQWNALNTTGIGSSGSAHRRFRERRDAGVFGRFWQNGLLACEHPDGTDCSWLSVDGGMTTSPLPRTKKQDATPRTQGHRDTGRKAQSDDRYRRASSATGRRSSRQA